MALPLGQVWTPRSPCRAWGQLKTELVVQPAAGADWTWTAPAGYVTRIVTGRALLALSAKVAARRLAMLLTDGHDVVWKVHAAETDAANAVIDVNIGQGALMLTPGQQSKSIEWGYPELLLPAGFTLSAETEAIDAEDQWSAIALLTEQFEIDPDHDNYNISHAMHELGLIREALTGHA